MQNVPDGSREVQSTSIASALEIEIVNGDIAAGTKLGEGRVKGRDREKGV